jgi:CubicO group peptidase (beta-lactamase class C family)
MDGRALVASSVLALILGTAGCTGSIDPSGTEPAPEPPGRSLAARELRTYAEALAREYDFSGSIVVARGDKVLLAEGFGFADDAHRLPITRATRFPIASATKPITATGVLQLEDEGHLRLDDSVCTYVSGCPRAWEPIRIVELLNQTAGLPELPVGALDGPLGEVIDDLKDEPLLFPHGTDYTYSNSNYLVAGAIVEQASGMSWDQFLETMIFEPTGMTQTVSDTSPEAHKDPVVGYSSSLSPTGERIPVTARLSGRMGHATPDPSPAGGLLSTADDLLAFVRSLDEGELLSRPVLRRMWSPVGPARYADYGLGWERTEQNGTWVAQHGGAMPGFSSCVSLYPREDVYVVILSNLGETVACEFVGRDLGAIVLGQPYKMPRAPSPIRVSPRVLRRYIGLYRADAEVGGGEVEVTVDRGQVVLNGLVGLAPAVNRKTILRPWSPTAFFNPHDPAVRVTFKRGRNTMALVFHSPAYKRLPPSRELWTRAGDGSASLDGHR